MILSDSLIKRAFHLAEQNEFAKSKEALDCYLKEVENLNCHDNLVFGTFRLCSGGKPNKLDIRMPLSWEILEKQGNRLLLISEFCLDWNCYNGNCPILGPSADTTWENSTIRQELNNEFFDNSFSENEKFIIVTTEIKTKPNPICGNNPGNDTQDKIFLLSIEEMLKYYSANDRIPLPEDKINQLVEKIISDRHQYFYIGNFGAKTELLMADDLVKDKINKDPYSWWLRTPGVNQKKVSVVTHDGYIDFGGISSSADEVGIRPAMWIDFDLAKNFILTGTSK